MPVQEPRKTKLDWPTVQVSTEICIACCNPYLDDLRGQMRNRNSTPLKFSDLSKQMHVL